MGVSLRQFGPFSTPIYMQEILTCLENNVISDSLKLEMPEATVAINISYKTAFNILGEKFDIQDFCMGCVSCLLTVKQKGIHVTISLKNLDVFHANPSSNFFVVT